MRIDWVDKARSMKPHYRIDQWLQLLQAYRGIEALHDSVLRSARRIGTFLIFGKIERAGDPCVDYCPTLTLSGELQQFHKLFLAPTLTVQLHNYPHSSLELIYCYYIGVTPTLHISHHERPNGFLQTIQRPEAWNVSYFSSLAQLIVASLLELRLIIFQLRSS